MAPEKTNATERQDPAAPAASQGKGMKKLLPIIVGAVLLVVGLAGGVFLAPMLSPKEEAPTAEVEPIDKIIAEATSDGAHGGGHGSADSGSPTPAAGGAAPSTKDLTFQFGSNIVVNLLEPTGRQFIQMGIQIRATSAEARQLIEDNEAPLRDATIMLISGKTMEDLQGPAGMDRLKNELRARYDGVLGRPRAIGDIYFIDRLIMRQ